jgi:hypothetical protein
MSGKHECSSLVPTSYRSTNILAFVVGMSASDTRVWRWAASVLGALDIGLVVKGQDGEAEKSELEL